MEEKTLTFERLQAFRQALIAQERSAATVEKYVRNARVLCGMREGKRSIRHSFCPIRLCFLKRILRGA